MEEIVQKKMSKLLPTREINFFARPTMSGCKFLWQVIKAHCPEEAAERFCILQHHRGSVEVMDHGIFDIVYLPKATKRDEK